MKLNLKNKKLLSVLILTVVLFSVLFINTDFALAQESKTEELLGNAFSWLIYWVAIFFSWLVGFLIAVMIMVASYNNFVDIDMVAKGWVIIRDVANNFFIVILLVIAVGTILRVPNYNRQLLPKLLLMAVLINFSKMFTGIFIDFSQVIMMWFADTIVRVNKDGGILLYTLGIHDAYKMDTSGQVITTSAKVGIGETISTLMFIVLISIIAAVVVAMITLMLIYRIIALWFLVILSPLAYLLTTFPKGQGYAAEWWSELSKNLVAGPVMMFFLYIAFFAGAVNLDDPKSQTSTGRVTSITNNQAQGFDDISNQSQTTIASGSTGVSVAQNPGKFFNYLIIIGLMVGSLVAGQKVGGAGAKFASKGISTLNKWGKGAARGAISRTDQTLGVSKLAYRAGVGRVPILGTALGKRVGALSDETAKRQGAKISAAANILKGKSHSELNKIASSQYANKQDRIAATQALAKKGLLKDDKTLSKSGRQERVDIIDQARSDLKSTPELLKSFDDNIRKGGSGLAASSSMYMKDGKTNIGKMKADMRSGDLNIAKAISSTDDSTLKAIELASGGGGDSIAKFLLDNTDKKGFEDTIKSLNKQARKAVLGGVSVSTVTRNGKVDEDDREKLLSATKQSVITKVFGESKDEKEAMAKHFEKKRKEVRENISAEDIKGLVHVAGDRFNDEDIKAFQRTTEHKKAFGDALQEEIGSIDITDTKGELADKISKLMKTAITAGIKEVKYEGTEKENNTSEKNAMRSKIYEERVATELSANQIRSGKHSDEQIRSIARNGNVGSIKSVFVDPGSAGETANKLAGAMRELRDESEPSIITPGGAPKSPINKERIKQVKDFL